MQFHGKLCMIPKSWFLSISVSFVLDVAVGVGGKELVGLTQRIMLCLLLLSILCWKSFGKEVEAFSSFSF